MPASSRTTASLDAVVVGAGLAGIYMLHRLRSQGLAVRVLEAGGGIGGTWYWNGYPGARVDIESIGYSYGFSPELEQEWEWSERYAGQKELLAYINHVADRFDLRPDIQLDTRVVSAHYDDVTRGWRIGTEAGQELHAKYCIFAAGCLSKRKLPDFPGSETFGGESYMSSDWPKQGVSFEGKRVGIIGTGSTGIQLITEVGRQAEHLTVFQRTPNFCIPARNRPLQSTDQEKLKANYRDFRRAQRASGFGMPDPPGAGRSLDEVDDEELEKIVEGVWERGTPIELLGTFADLMVDETANARVAELVRAKIRETVADPEVAERLCPTDHPIGIRRLCIDHGYFETYNRDNVELVDLRETPIEEVVPEGIRTSDRVHPLDMIVYALGFDAVTGALTAIDIRGRDGVTLNERWAEGPHMYLGLGMEGMPNLFTVTGPGSPSLLSNVIVAIEQHVDWISNCIEYLEENSIETIEASSEAEEEWMRQVHEIYEMTLHTKYDTYYSGSNIAGKPRAFTHFLGGLGNYGTIIDSVAEDGYRGFDLEPAAVIGAP